MNLLLKNPELVVTCSGNAKRFKRGSEMNDVGILSGVDIYIEDGTIKKIGKITPDSDCDVLDVSGKILVPGFVDPHTHGIFAGTGEHEFALRAKTTVPLETTFDNSGILETVRKTREASKSYLRTHAERRLDKMLKWGTTTVEIKSGYGLDFKNEIKLLEAIREMEAELIPDIVVTFLGAHVILPEHDHDAYMNILTEELIPYIAKKRLADFCDVFCDREGFTAEDARKILAVARDQGFKLKMHTGSSSTSGGVKLAVELGATSVDCIEKISSDEIELLSRSDTVGVILPATSCYLRARPAPAREMIDQDCAIAIASDFGPCTSMVDNMQTTMWLAICFNSMTVEEALNAATINAAAALGLSDVLGSIEVGKQADVLIVDAKDYAYLPYHFTENRIEKVVKRGIVLEFP
ncbi:MAG TPA: imidazolonepropionase [Candidatus Acidoferrales bacterium]|nr:imidazolonepropionase [Candidatus Acidoferrales bacterium]